MSVSAAFFSLAVGCLFHCLIFTRYYALSKSENTARSLWELLFFAALVPALCIFFYYGYCKSYIGEDDLFSTLAVPLRGLSAVTVFIISAALICFSLRLFVISTKISIRVFLVEMVDCWLLMAPSVVLLSISRVKYDFQTFLWVWLAAILAWPSLLSQIRMFKNPDKT